MFHQDIYGSGYDHSDSDGMILRTQLTPVIDKYGFDAVLKGHDHTYSRTYQLSANGVQEAFDKNSDTSSQAFYNANANAYNIVTKAEENNKVINPEGTVYFEANSATGSKYYQLIGTRQNYIAARSQSWRPTYSVLDITDVTLTVRTYDAATNEELVANLEAAVMEAKKIYDNPEADSLSVASAVTSLNDAVAALAVVPVVPDQDTNHSAGSDTDNDTDKELISDTGIQDDSNSPETGDNTLSTVLWFMLGGASLAGIASLYMSEKRNKKGLKE